MEVQLNEYLIKYRSRDGKRILSGRFSGPGIWEVVRHLPVSLKRRIVEVWHADERVSWEQLHG